jgi:hypothetical protein
MIEDDTDSDEKHVVDFLGDDRVRSSWSVDVPLLANAEMRPRPNV